MKQSKVAEFRKYCGVVSDAQVAAMAGVTRAAVTQFRKKRGIPSLLEISFSRKSKPISSLVTNVPTSAPAGHSLAFTKSRQTSLWTVTLEGSAGETKHVKCVADDILKVTRSVHLDGFTVVSVSMVSSDVLLCLE